MGVHFTSLAGVRRSNSIIATKRDIIRAIGTSLYQILTSRNWRASPLFSTIIYGYFIEQFQTYFTAELWSYLANTIASNSLICRTETVDIKEFNVLRDKSSKLKYQVYRFPPPQYWDVGIRTSIEFIHNKNICSSITLDANGLP